MNMVTVENRHGPVKDGVVTLSGRGLCGRSFEHKKREPPVWEDSLSTGAHVWKRVRIFRELNPMFALSISRGVHTANQDTGHTETPQTVWRPSCDS